MCNNHNYTTTQARIIRYGERACDDSIWPPHLATHTAITFPEATLTSRVRIKKEKETSSFYMNLIDPSVQLIQNNNHSMHFWKLPITGKQSSFSFLFSYCFLLQTSTPPPRQFLAVHFSQVDKSFSPQGTFLNRRRVNPPSSLRTPEGFYSHTT